MKKAQEMAKEFSGMPDIRDESIMDSLKAEINNMLHMYLPSHITIGQSETLALVINDIIWNPEKYLTNE